MLHNIWPASSRLNLTIFIVLCRRFVLKELQPLRLLIHSANRIAEGDYSEPVPATKREDEIGQLQHRFRKMQKSLAAHVNELEQLKARGDTASLSYFEKQDLDNMTDSMKHNTILLRRMILMLYESSEAGASEEKKCKRLDELSCNEIARQCISYSKTRHPGVLIRFESTVPDKPGRRPDSRSQLS